MRQALLWTHGLAEQQLGPVGHTHKPGTASRPQDCRSGSGPARLAPSQRMHYSLPSTCTHSTAQSAGAHPTHIMCPHHGLLVGRESRPATVRPPHAAHTPTASRVSWTQHCHQAWSHRDCVGGGPLPLPSWTMLPQPFHFSPK